MHQALLALQRACTALSPEPCGLLLCWEGGCAGFTDVRVSPAGLTAPWLCRHAPRMRWKGDGEILIASKKFCSLPPWSIQLFTFSFLHPRQFPQVPNTSGTRAVRAACADAGELQCSPAGCRSSHQRCQMPHTADPRVHSLQCALRCCIDSKACVSSLFYLSLEVSFSKSNA